MALPSWLSYFVMNFLLRARLPVGISIDLTNRCNLACKHCYFRHQKQQPELDDEQMLARIHSLKMEYPSALHGGWVGGEPLLRAELLSRGTQLFPFNMVVTNGTLPLPKLKNCVFNVSIDGTKQVHEAIRGGGIYDKIKAHADRDDLSVNINCVLHRINAPCLEAMVAEWRKTRIRGMSFSFYSPQRTGQDPLPLNPGERDAVVARLLSLKKEHGDFILNSSLVLKMMRSDPARTVTSRCLAPRAFISIDASGVVKRPCVMGPGTDCSRCGCVVPFAVDAVYRKMDFGTIRINRKFYTEFHSTG